jgi:hypothetical protein
MYIEVAMRQTKNSKVIGLDGICPYWLKKFGCKKLNESILILMNLICKNKIFPLKFNDCKFKPILRDFC